jgi:ABC-2 type transport system ATP-binding protein
MTGNGAPILEVTNLVKRYGEIVAVDGLTLNVERGEIFGLLGPNGAGKTTAISVISTLQKPDAGSVRVGGLDATQNGGGVRRMFGLVPQEIALFPRSNAWENLEYFGGIYGLAGRALRDRIQEVLEIVALTEFARRPKAGKFSGGMLRRLNLAAGLLHRPSLLLLDEPTVGVDAQSRNHIFENIRLLNREHGTTILYTTHYMEEAESLCGRVAIMDRGRIVACDTVAALLASAPGTIFDITLAFPVDGLANALRLSGGVLEVDEEGAHYRIRAAGQKEGLAAVQQALAANGVALESLKVSSASLEQVFLNLTGKALRDEAA